MSRRRHHNTRETVAQAIARYAPTREVAYAMGLGALMEGGTLGSGPFNVGDNGQSFGPFQIYMVAHHDITPQQAANPDSAVRYMLRAYENASKQVPQSLWNTNPELAAERTAFLAEHPLHDYYQTEDVHAKWAALQGKVPGLKKQPVGKWTPGAPSGQLASGFMSGLGGGSNTIALVVAVILVIVIIAKR